MSKFMKGLKEKLKRSQNIVVLYEAVVGGCIKIKKSIFNLLERCLPYTIYMAIRIWDYRITTKDKTKLFRGPYFYKWKPFSKKKYCIIRIQRPDHALFAAGRQYVYAAEYAKRKGMYPLLDIEWNDDFENGDLGKRNIWEYVFAQRRVQDILKEDATILVSKYGGGDMCLSETCFDINKNREDDYIHATEEKWRDYYTNIYKYVEKYWKFNKDFLFEADREFKEIFGNGENILGVSLRENFSREYFALIEKEDAKEMFRRHPLGPDVHEIIEIVEDYLTRWNCEKIFVATMFDSSIRMFEERFQGRILYAKRKRFTNLAEAAAITNLKKNWKDQPSGDAVKSHSEEMVECQQYAQEILLISKCAYFIGAKSGGTIAALMLNGGQYKDIKILEDKRQIARY